MKTGPEVTELIRLLALPPKISASARLEAARKLRDLSGTSPQLVYPHFGLLAQLLRHDNAIIRWNAILTLGNLASVDTEGRLERILKAYLAPIPGPHLIDAAHTIRGAAAIAEAKPHLADTIVRQILKTERAVYATPECRNVAIGHALAIIDRLAPIVTRKRAIQLFVSRQSANPRAATRNKAAKLLHKWSSHEPRRL